MNAAITTGNGEVILDYTVLLPFTPSPATYFVGEWECGKGTIKLILMSECGHMSVHPHVCRVCLAGHPVLSPILAV